MNSYNAEYNPNNNNNNVLIYTISSIVLIGTAFFVGRKLIRDAIKNNQENKSADEGTEGYYAKAIKMAFDNDGWLGTDMNALRTTIIAIPHKKMFGDVMKSYQKLYNKNLLSDLQNELQTSQYNEIITIINAKADNKTTSLKIDDKQYEAWAKRLKSAFDKSYGFIPGTDEEAIKNVFFEIPNQKAFVQMSKAYTYLFKTSLANDLKSELEFWEYEPIIKIIKDKPN